MPEAALTDFVAGWDSPNEKLRCHILLVDNVAQALSPRAGPAFFRAFIVEDRATGAVSMKFRYNYKNPDDKKWYGVTTDKRGDAAVEYMRNAITVTLMTALSVLVARREIPEKAVLAFYPPDDGGDPAKTVIWLDMRDLIEITAVKEETNA
jgi:hypothetical protein